MRWYGADHKVDLSERSLQLAYCLHGASQNDADIYVMINSVDKAIDFGIHEGVVGHWPLATGSRYSSGKPRGYLGFVRGFRGRSYLLGQCKIGSRTLEAQSARRLIKIEVD